MNEGKISAAPMNENLDAEDPQRRTLAFALLGMFGGASLLQGCEASAEGIAADGTGAVSNEVIGTSSMVWVDTIADLKKVTGEGTTAALKSTVVVLGYAARGDGGGGIFTWIKATPPAAGDGGTIFLPTSQPSSPNGPGYWKRLYSGPLNVKWFGAKGDNVTADDAAMNAAASALGPVGGTIAFSPGRYRLSSSITFGEQISLEFTGGSVLAPDFGTTLTIFGPVRAASAGQIFTAGVGAGAVNFGTNSSPINVRWFGAKGDGITSDTDTPAFRAALAAKEASPNGGVIEAPPGVYLLTGPIELGLKPLWLRGAGFGRPDTALFGPSTNFTRFTGTIFKTTDSTNDLFVASIPFANDYANAYRGILLTDFAVFGPGTGNTAGIRFTSQIMSHVIGRNLHFANFSIGFDPGAAEASSFQYLHAIGCQTGFRIGLTPDGTNPTSLRFDHVVADACGIGIDVQDCQTVDLLGLCLSGNTSSGLRIRNATRMEVSFSHCETNGIGVLFDQSDAGVSAQHIDLHGLRSATPTDGLSFTGSGAVAYCSFRNLDLRNMPGDLVVPSNVQTSCFGPIQIGSGKIVFNGSANWAVTEGNISMGGLGFNGAVVVLSGFGDPNGSVPASIGSLYMRINGGPGTTLYVKESGPGVTGWVPK